MAGHSRPKDGVASARRCPGHPRFSCSPSLDCAPPRQVPNPPKVVFLIWFAIIVLCTVREQNLAESSTMTGSHDHTDCDHCHPHDDAQRWKHDGVRVIPGDQLDPNVPSTAGMDRKAAINFARVGAQKLWAGTVTIKPDAKTGAHNHGHLESIIYVVRGKARMRWGEHLQFMAEANPDQALECVLVRSDGEAVAINLDIEPVEKPETVLWVDPVHRDPAETE